LLKLQSSKAELGSITLIQSLKDLNQVVVIGYGTQRKVDLTGSVAVVNTEEMKKVSNSNISTMLEGKVAGVQITTDGQPGADPTVLSVVSVHLAALLLFM
jgi:outer membrane receptor for Fe3+-dicitrate